MSATNLVLEARDKKIPEGIVIDYKKFRRRRTDKMSEHAA